MSVKKTPIAVDFSKGDKHIVRSLFTRISPHIGRNPLDLLKESLGGEDKVVEVNKQNIKGCLLFRHKSL